MVMQNLGRGGGGKQGVLCMFYVKMVTENSLGGGCGDKEMY